MFDLEFYRRLKIVVDNLIEPFTPNVIRTIHNKSELKKLRAKDGEVDYLSNHFNHEDIFNYLDVYLNYFNLEIKRTCFNDKFIAF